MSNCMECIQRRLMLERKLKQGNFIEKAGVIYYLRSVMRTQGFSETEIAEALDDVS